MKNKKKTVKAWALISNGYCMEVSLSAPYLRYFKALMANNRNTKFKPLKIVECTIIYEVSNKNHHEH